MNNEAFATNLRVLLAQKHMTQSSLARALSRSTHEHISAAAVGKWCRGESHPNRSNQLALATLLGVTVSQLLGDEPLNGEKPSSSDVQMVTLPGSPGKTLLKIRKVVSSSLAMRIVSLIASEE